MAIYKDRLSSSSFFLFTKEHFQETEKNFDLLHLIYSYRWMGEWMELSSQSLLLLIFKSPEPKKVIWIAPDCLLAGRPASQASRPVSALLCLFKLWLFCWSLFIGEWCCSPVSQWPTAHSMMLGEFIKIAFRNWNYLLFFLLHSSFLSFFFIHLFPQWVSWIPQVRSAGRSSPKKKKKRTIMFIYSLKLHSPSVPSTRLEPTRVGS